VSFPLALAAAIGLNPGDQVQWELLDRDELRLVRVQAPPPAAKRRFGKT
jgi:antitoxin component of MazEF toxin-antitoxin module